jgi:hypothetical protein
MSQGKKDEQDPLETAINVFWNVVGAVKPAIVGALSWLDEKNSSVRIPHRGLISDATESVNSVQNEVDRRVMHEAKRMSLISEYLNSEYRFASSLARSHPYQLIATTSLGFGLLCAAPLKAVQLPGSWRVFKVCTVMAIPASCAFTKLVQFKWIGKEHDLHE